MTREYEGYREETVEGLIQAFQERTGDREFIFQVLLMRYAPLIRRHQRRFYNLGIEASDFEQEMALDLWLAVQRYNPSFGVTFGAYLSVRLYNRCLDLYRFHNHPKRYTVEGTAPLDVPATDTSPCTELAIAAAVDRPDYRYWVKEMWERVSARLSPLESHVLTHSMEGKTFPEIASDLVVSEQRVRYAYYRHIKNFVLVRERKKI